LRCAPGCQLSNFVLVGARDLDPYEKQLTASFLRDCAAHLVLLQLCRDCPRLTH
jgi:hypothetical protein